MNECEEARGRRSFAFQKDSNYSKNLPCTPALLLRVDDTKEDKHSDVQLDLLSISRLFFSRFSILNVGSVLSKSFLVWFCWFFSLSWWLCFWLEGCSCI